MSDPGFSFNQLRSWWRIIRVFVDRHVLSLILKSVSVGILLFFIESSFILVIQGFMWTLGILEESKVMLPSWYPRSALAAVLILVVFGVFRGAAHSLKSYLAGVTHHSFNRRQREKLLEYGLTHASESSAHEIINLFMERVAQAGSVLNSVSQLALTVTSAVLLLFLGLRLAPLELVMGIGLLALLLLPLRVLNQRVQSYGMGLTEESERGSRILLQGMRHHFFLRIYGLIPLEIERGRTSLKRFESFCEKYQLIYALKTSAPLMVGVVVISFITYVSVTWIHTPSVKLLGFFYIFIRIAQASAEANSTFAELRFHFPGLQRLYQWSLKAASRAVVSAPASNGDPEQWKRFSEDFSKQGINVRLEHVSFAFEGSPPLFQDLNLEVSRGNTLVIQGPSGSGKSTLLTLILGMNTPQKGRVLINDRPIQDVREPLYGQIAYVGPEPYLIPGTVRDNLLYGHQRSDKGGRVPDSEIWEALEKAQLAREIQRLPAQLDEVLLEHAQLSTGQKQRIAIARAILRKPKLLILDEASANLDAVTEERFIASIQGLLKDLTTLVISHKASFNGIATHRIELGQ